jgi:NAD(P)-dependent dehydrogenase (short-subunit alcohol dehydrogenase family)
VGKPEDVAATIAYLASDDAAFVQGAALRVDGGRLSRL